MRRPADFSLGLVSGTVAGLAAAFVMSEFQALWAASDAQIRRRSETSTPATLTAADKASEAVAGAPVPKPARKIASNGVHYLTGAVLGGLYGVAAEFFPGVTGGLGAAYGGAAWVVMDEVVVPMFDLGPSPTETGPKDHIYGLASHIVFGLALEVAREAMADTLSPV